MEKEIVTIDDEIESLKERYQRTLIDEYLENNPEAHEYSYENLKQMFPLSANDIAFVVISLISEIKGEITSLEEDIESSLKKLNDPKVKGMEKSEINSDVAEDRNKIARLKNKFYLIKDYCQREELDLGLGDESGTRNGR